MKKPVVAYAVFAAVLCAAPAAAADTCSLLPLGSLAMTALPDGETSVPVAINGKDRAMLLELGVSDTAVSDTLASELYLSKDVLPEHAVFAYRGALADGQVTLPRLRLGAITGDQVPVLHLVPGTVLPPGVSGVLGVALLKNSDLDIDFHNNKINLFSPKHCDGAVVYWADTAAVVPFTFNDLNRLVFQMELDGKPVSVSIRPGATGRISLGTFRRLFGAPSMTLSGQDMHGESLFAYPFQTLSVGGITLRNPAIRVVDDGASSGCSAAHKPLECFGRTDIEIGLSELKALHLYFAFGEKKLYATAADAHK